MSTRFAIEVPDSLIAAARAGEMAALERVYRLFEQPGYTLAVRLLGDAEEAREVWHDAVLSAFGRLQQYRGESPFWAWLRQIVANTALMRLRQRQRSDAQHVDGLTADDLTETVGYSPALAAEAAVLERALAELPDVTRSVIWLYCIEGYSHPEIAELMVQTVSFSKSQLARGLSRMRRLLKVEEVLSHAGCA